MHVHNSGSELCARDTVLSTRARISHPEILDIPEILEFALLLVTAVPACERASTCRVSVSSILAC